MTPERPTKDEPVLEAERLAELADALRDPEAALAALPPDEQRAYREAQQSVIDARRHGERIARELWIG